MPFQIICQDITEMQVDAIVNSANPNPVIGCGLDAGIHKKAGPELLRARQQIGAISVGQAACTPAFRLAAKYVIHAVGPVWQGGQCHEDQQLAQCYQQALELAHQHGCQSVAVPLISTGNHQFPPARALQIAIRVFSEFLWQHEMHIYLVVFRRQAIVLSQRIVGAVARFIDAKTIHQVHLQEYGISHDAGDGALDAAMARRQAACRNFNYQENAPYPAPGHMPTIGAPCASAATTQDLEHQLAQMDAGFSETLLSLIDRTGKTDAQIYKKANVDRKLFSKIRNNRKYQPSKTTALAFALALELDLDETRDFIGRAGFALSHSNKFDIIIEYFILHRNYDIFEINEVLFAFDQPLIGA